MPPILQDRKDRALRAGHAVASPTGVVANRSQRFVVAKRHNREAAITLH
jgi:hypothetical protein